MVKIDSSAAIKNIQNLEGIGQIVWEILRFIVSKTKTHKLDRGNAQSKRIAQKFVESVPPNKSRAHHSSHQTHGKGGTMILVSM